MAAQNDHKPETRPDDELLDGRLISLAENIGWFLGTAQNRTHDWLDRAEVRREVNRIRTTAAELLKHLKLKRAAARRASAKKGGARKGNGKARSGSGANVDAPGKRHRKPPPQEKVARGGSASAIKKMGKKSPTTPRKFL